MDKKEWEDSITPVFDLDHFYEIESIRKMRESLEDNRSKWWGHLPANKYIKTFLDKVSEVVSPKNILEIGVCLGYSSTYMLQTFVDATVFGIDIRNQTISNCSGIDAVKTRYGERFSVTIDDSKNILNHYEKNMFDLCHIDGDHSYEYALRDIKNCKVLNIPYLMIDNIKGHQGAEGVLKSIEDEKLDLIFLEEYVNIKQYQTIETYPPHDNAVRFSDQIGLFKWT